MVKDIDPRVKRPEFTALDQLVTYLFRCGFDKLQAERKEWVNQRNELISIGNRQVIQVKWSNLDHFFFMFDKDMSTEKYFFTLRKAMVAVVTDE